MSCNNSGISVRELSKCFLYKLILVDQNFWTDLVHTEFLGRENAALTVVMNDWPRGWVLAGALGEWGWDGERGHAAGARGGGGQHLVVSKVRALAVVRGHARLHKLQQLFHNLYADGGHRPAAYHARRLPIFLLHCGQTMNNCPQPLNIHRETRFKQWKML